MFNGDTMVARDLTVRGSLTVVQNSLTEIAQNPGDLSVGGDLTVGGSLVIGGHVLTSTDVEQLRNILDQLAGTDDSRKECLRYAWKTFATC
jgi:hypothetical protein